MAEVEKNPSWRVERLMTFNKIIHSLSQFCWKYPGSNLEDILKKLSDRKEEAIPKDHLAIYILQHLFYDVPGENDGGINSLKEMRFSDLPPHLLPLYLGERDKIEIAYWGNKNDVSDRILSLLNLDGQNRFWCDVNGKKVVPFACLGEQL